MKILGDEAIRHFYMALPRYEIDKGIKAVEDFLQEAKRDMAEQLANKITEDMPQITRYGALEYLRNLARELKQQAERK